MRRLTSLTVLFCFVLSHFELRAGEPASPFLAPPEPTATAQPKTEQPKTELPKAEQPKEKEKQKDLVVPPKTDVFDPSILPTRQAAATFTPQMMGDFPVAFTPVTIRIFGVLTSTTTLVTTTFKAGTTTPPKPVAFTTTTTKTSTTPTSQLRTILVPVSTAAGAFKVADNESPRPQDRVCLTWNYFDGIQGPPVGPTGPVSMTQTTTMQTSVPNRGLPPTTFATTANGTAVYPAAPQVVANINREVFGFEKTFLDGRASIELRVPCCNRSTPTSKATA